MIWGVLRGVRVLERRRLLTNTHGCVTLERYDATRAWTFLHVQGRSVMTGEQVAKRSTRGSRVTLLGDDDLHYF